MNKTISIIFCDRQSGELRREKVHAAGFLRWLYNTSTGQVVRRALTFNRLFSAVYGSFHRTRISRHKIRPFVRKMNIDMNESVRRIEDFTSFNDFFVREIKAQSRPVDPGPDACVAPADGKVLVFEKVDSNTTFRIKRCTFNLRDFLKDDTLAEAFSGGSMFISRLSLGDYHHFHFPDSGTAGSSDPVRGRYNAGGPYSAKNLIPFYTENYRMKTLLNSDHFGRIAMVEVGALTVGSIRQSFEDGARVLKGERKGHFELGGSTVVLLFEKGAIRFSGDLLENSASGVETFVRFGEAIGHIKRNGIGKGRRK